MTPICAKQTYAMKTENFPFESTPASNTPPEPASLFIRSPIV
jgi:hypothetical protein